MIKKITLFAGYFEYLAYPCLLLIIIAFTSSSNIAQQHVLLKKNLEHFRIFRNNYLAYITHKEVRSKKIMYFYLRNSTYYTHKEYQNDISTRSKET